LDWRRGIKNQDARQKYFKKNTKVYVEGQKLSTANGGIYLEAMDKSGFIEEIYI
jgi:hypothetical protein